MVAVRWVPLFAFPYCTTPKGTTDSTLWTTYYVDVHVCVKKRARIFGNALVAASAASQTEGSQGMM